jgi:hypothetical protein
LWVNNSARVAKISASPEEISLSGIKPKAAGSKAAFG